MASLALWFIRMGVTGNLSSMAMLLMVNGNIDNGGPGNSIVVVMDI